MSIDYIEQLACEFRDALDVVAKRKLYGRLSIFQCFPRGCCRYTSDLLAQFMLDNGIEANRIEMVEAETNEDNYTHCWLMIDNVLFVDITADQFNEELYFKRYTPIPACCLVSRDTYLYECFNRSKMQFLQNVGIDSYGGDIPFKLQVVYDAVIQQINIKRQRR